MKKHGHIVTIRRLSVTEKHGKATVFPLFFHRPICYTFPVHSAIKGRCGHSPYAAGSVSPTNCAASPQTDAHRQWPASVCTHRAKDNGNPSDSARCLLFIYHKPGSYQSFPPGKCPGFSAPIADPRIPAECVGFQGTGKRRNAVDSIPVTHPKQAKKTYAASG